MDNRSNISLTGQTTLFLTGKQLSEVLDVAAPTLSEAARSGYNCGGQPVAEWAEFSGSGRIKGYEVPEFLVDETANQKPEKRANPKPEPPSKAKNNPNEPNTFPNKGDATPDNWQELLNQMPQLQQVTNTNQSILPEGEDYVRPVGMASLSSVLKKALDKDTPQGRAVIMSMITMLGAITGHSVSDKAGGAAIGAGAGFSVAMIAYTYFGGSETATGQSATPANNTKALVRQTQETFKKSDFLNN